MTSLIPKTQSASRGTTSGVRRPVSKDTPDRTDAHRRTCPASEVVRSGRTGQTGRWDESIGYTAEDLKDFDRLLRELAECEDWPEDELQRALADRKRMAPVRVPGALQELRKAHRAALAVWPDTPATRTRIELLEVA